MDWLIYAGMLWDRIWVGTSFFKVTNEQPMHEVRNGRIWSVQGPVPRFICRDRVERSYRPIYTVLKSYQRLLWQTDLLDTSPVEFDTRKLSEEEMKEYQSRIKAVRSSIEAAGERISEEDWNNLVPFIMAPCSFREKIIPEFDFFFGERASMVESFPRADIMITTI